MSTPALSIQGLRKQFTKHGPAAVSDLNFEIQAGESVAFLGPNGAGKSTTIKMLCGILTPSTGHALIEGFPAGSHQANRLLGLVFGTRSQLYLHMTVAQCLDLVAEIYYVTGRHKENRIRELAALFHIEALMPVRVRTLSLGQRMRCEIIAALVHQPRILLADEPTIGLDIVAKNQLRELILRWQNVERTTLMLTSHDLSDVEALCKRCILIDKGQKQFDGSISDLKGELSTIRRIRVTTSSSEPGLLNTHAPLKILSSQEYVHAYEICTKRYPMANALSLLSTHYADSLVDIAISEVTLEEVINRIYLETH